MIDNQFNKLDNDNDYGKNCQSEQECENDLKQNYNSPGHPIAFSGINAIYNYYKGKLNHEKIKNVLSGIENYTLHREYHQGQRNISYSHFKGYRWEMDLVDVQSLAEHNDGVRYLLTTIDTFTRFARVRMIATKQADVVLEAFKSILRSADQPPKILVIDRGTEFLNRPFEKYCRENNIELRTPDSFIHGAYIERFNRTLQSLIYKYMTENETYRYVDKTIENSDVVPVLSNLVFTYNNRKHRMIGTTPQLAETDPSTHLDIRIKMSKYYASIKKSKSPKFNVGDYVRIAALKGKFSRGYQEQSSQEIFKILDINTKKEKPMYVLETFDGSEIIKGSFYDFELTKVNSDTFRVEKVLKTKKLKNGQTMHYVKWKGFTDKYNSWINATDIQKKF